MPTHAEMAARLLTDAAEFYRNLGAQNPPLKSQMNENAAVFERMAELIEGDPTGAVTGGKTHAALASGLLLDGARFFRVLGEQNELIRDQMILNAESYEQISAQVADAPLGILD